jgi:hypothetical protein
MGLRLFELTSEYAEIRNRMEEVAIANEGEIDDNLERILADLDSISGERTAKMGNCVAITLEADAEADKIEAMAKALVARAKACRSVSERLREYIDCSLLPGEKVKTEYATVYRMKTSSVEVECEPEELPVAYQRITVEPNKTELKAAIKAGCYIENVSIVEKQSLVIRK